MTRRPRSRPVCRWIGCNRPATRESLCGPHRTRTLEAGRRAARGDTPGEVFDAIRRADLASTPVPDRLDDLEWLLETGEHPPRAATRCGWTIDTARTLASRHNRPHIVEALRTREPSP